MKGRVAGSWGEKTERDGSFTAHSACGLGGWGWPRLKSLLCPTHPCGARAQARGYALLLSQLHKEQLGLKALIWDASTSGGDFTWCTTIIYLIVIASSMSSIFR